MESTWGEDVGNRIIIMTLIVLLKLCNACPEIKWRVLSSQRRKFVITLSGSFADLRCAAEIKRFEFFFCVCKIRVRRICFSMYTRKRRVVSLGVKIKYWRRQSWRYGLTDLFPTSFPVILGGLWRYPMWIPKKFPPLLRKRNTLRMLLA